MPVGRARLVADSSLKITGLTVEDAGVYICQAENSVATVVANATLTVYGEYPEQRREHCVTGREKIRLAGEQSTNTLAHPQAPLKIGGEVCFTPKTQPEFLLSLTYGQKLESRLFGGEPLTGAVSQ